MKKFFFILLLFMWTLGMSAETYSALWKQVETAQQQDQPKSAIAALKKIQQKATKEKSYGNLLAAMIKEVNQQAEISEEAMKSCKSRLKAQQQQWQKQGNGVMYALSGIAMGQNISLDSLLTSPDADIYVRAETSTEYVPFIDKKSDSRYFHNDLLHIIAMYKGEHEKLYRYYVSAKDRQAAAVTAAVIMKGKPCNMTTVAQCDSLISLYQDLPACSILKNVRQDFWEAFTLPGFYATIPQNRVNTKMPVKIYFDNVRNISGIRVHLTTENASLLNSQAKVQTRDFTLTLPKHEEWELMKDTLDIGCLPLGKWTVILSDMEGKIKSEQQQLFVTDLRVIQQKMPKDSTWNVVVNDITGQPEPKAQLINHRGKVSATLGDDTAMPEYALWSNYSYSKPMAVQHYLNIYTDRSIYRPGQTVHVAILRHDVLEGTQSQVADNDTVKLILRDSQNKQIDDRTLITDDYGVAHIDFTLPADGRNGSYTIAGSGKASSYASFSIEEYKRPTFDVTLQQPSEKYHEGDTLNILGTAKTYSGAAVANARVIYTVKQYMALWWRQQNSTTLLSDTLFTDADGHFTLRVPIPVIKKHVCSLYTITAGATVMDNGGESQGASLSLPLVYRDTVTTTPPVNPKDVFSMSGKEFTPQGVTMKLGTTDRNVHVFYALYTANKILEKGSLTINANNYTRTFYYKPEYGDGITISLAWVKDGKMYTHTASIKKPLPDKTLTLKWTSFRNKLVPGQKETWTLRVLGSSGSSGLSGSRGSRGLSGSRGSRGLSGSKGYKAQLMAVLYDKSLDAIRQHSWSLSDNRILRVPTTTWNTSSSARDYFYANAVRKNRPDVGLNFSSIAYDCIYNPYEGVRFLTGRPLRMVSNGAMMAKMSANLSSVNDAVSTNAPSMSPEESSVSSNMLLYRQALRSDFAETAFFMPQLMTDDNGIATLSFTLPESTTTWRFMALAHDKEMRYGTLIDEAIAQKSLMLQAKMPRFLRVGDKGQITANVSNLSEKSQTVNVTMTLMDGKTEKVISKSSKDIAVGTNATVPVTFDVSPDSTMTDGIICKFMADGDRFSDGEQHLLAVISEQPEKIDTTSFVVEPRKMILEALPQLAVPTSNNAIILSNAIYANVMTAHLKNVDANVDANVDDNLKKLAANDNVVAQLLALQNADGGFSWYKGMESSKYITVAVVKTLVRMNHICGKQNNTEMMLEKAFSYLETVMQKEMEWQKEHKTSYLTSTTLDWLYALSLKPSETVKQSETMKYFEKMLYSQTVKSDMQTKAVAGIVLNKNNTFDKLSNRKKAKEFAESIKQHTVYREDMGRYFDSYRAEYSWCDFRIPTQTMCIEALDDITPNDTTTITEMQKWLVQCKRTQSWDNAINAVNAVYALMLNSAQKPFMAAYKVNPEDYKDIIKVSRRFQKVSEGSKVSEGFKVGDRIKVTITIEADRDYDFVTVTDNRAACLEPVNQVSGYRYGYYQEMKDSKTVYHFNQLRKGIHTIETEYYINRAGSYTAGKTTARCEYAPEFRGCNSEITINVQ